MKILISGFSPLPAAHSCPDSHPAGSYARTTLLNLSDPSETSAINLLLVLAMLTWKKKNAMFN